VYFSQLGKMNDSVLDLRSFGFSSVEVFPEGISGTS
jgi:hypothetical protein